MDENLTNRIISVAYGEATFWEKIKILSLAKKNEEVNNLLKKHKEIADKTHNISIESFPDELLSNVKSITKVHEQKENSLLFDIYSFLFRRPAISTAIFSVIILALVSTFLVNRPEIHQQYSKQEIELADQQVKHSLALIAGVFKKTSSTVENDILTDRVSRPIKESFNLVNDYLQGDNNENIN